MSKFPAFSLAWIKSVWTILICIAAGAAAGTLFPDFAAQIAPFGDLYLSFLKMCVIPIMMTAIVSSIGGIFMNSNAIHILKRMLIVFAAGLLLVSAVGLTVGLIGQPGSGLSPEAKAVLGSVVQQAEQQAETGSGTGEERTTTNLLGFLVELIPPNIFIALGEGNSLQILFFSIVVGVTVGMVSTKAGENLLQLTDLLFKAFQQAISWSMYLLPFGLFCIMAGQLSAIGEGVFPAIMKLILWMYISSLIVMLISAGIIAKKVNMSIQAVFYELKDALVVAFGTRNSIAAIPASLHALSTAFRVEASSVRLVVPLGMILCRYSMILVYALGIMFTAQLYGVSLTMLQLVTVWIGAVLAALAGAGAPAMVSIAMIAMIAGPLQLPADTTIILLLAINPIIDPIITAANVLSNCAASVMISEKSSESDYTQPAKEDGGVPLVSLD
ncbi:dicarboxylate/amino acid:cation symporter [Paenibacillus eucommiae]|uniref:Proton glutamate symport protein n=1 Tax=Paenibacillus eucommiae TaxID=1355755 RepID=A0ABS4IQZ5_9BACL|nr:cation:dicarboxylase symporter family transporter [Paenibacillus eucommiae]MBP1989987.1 proton glutamate symport protein [Paenibacillus eucommiae]